MFSRFTLPILIAIIVGIALAGCGAATEEPPAQQPVSEALATTEPVVPTLAATEAPAAPDTAEEAPIAATSAPEAAEANSNLRTYQIVADQSEATYQVQEEFFNRPVNLASPIGRTNAIEGEFQLTISGNQVQLADNQFKVDLRTLSTDEARRDERIRNEWLESNTYPWAEFKATSVEDFPANAAEGQDVSFRLNGDMTIREITKPQTFDVMARLNGDTFTGTATTNLLMRDYGFEPPSILGMLEVSDGVTVTVNFTAQDINPGS